MADVLCAQTQTPAEYDEIVRQDIELFRQQANRFLAGELTDDQFRPFRLRRGIYGQRQPGVQMIRTKVPGGALTADQSTSWRWLPTDFARRQRSPDDAPEHAVPFRAVWPMSPICCTCSRMSALTTREACYNTVRNVTACPLSGLLPEEPFDVRPMRSASLSRSCTRN